MITVDSNGRITGIATTSVSSGGGATDKIEEGDSSVEVIDSGTGQVDVITDNDHPLFQDRKVPFGRIGYIQFVPMGALFTSAGEGLYAAPLDKNITTLPLRNEKVDIIKTTTGYYYRRGNG